MGTATAPAFSAVEIRGLPNPPVDTVEATLRTVFAPWSSSSGSFQELLPETSDERISYGRFIAFVFGNRPMRG